MDGGLINICTYDETDKFLYQHNKKRAYSYLSESMIKKGNKLYEITIRRNVDKYNLIGLTILRKSEEDTTIPIIDIECRIADNTIFQIPYELLKGLYKVNHIRKTTTIACDLEMFIKDIPLVRLAFHEVKFVVHLENSENIDDILVRSENILLEGDERKEFAKKDELKQTIQCLEQIEVKESDEEYPHGILYKAKVNCKGRSKGFFINCDVNNIRGFKLFVGYTLSSGEVKMYNYAFYDFAMLEHLCTRISDNILYIPFNKNVCYKNKSPSSYDGSIPFSKLDESYIEIITRTPVDTINIYSLSFNLLHTHSGIHTIIYDKNHEKIHNDYNDSKRWYYVDLPLEVRTKNQVGRVYYKCEVCNDVILEDLPKYFNSMSSIDCPNCSNSWTNWTKYCNR